MKRLALLLAVILLLTGCSSSSQKSPPESILYLGGAAILEEFEIDGGPGASNGMSSILIRIPVTLEMEGFHFAVIGITPDGTQDIIYTKNDLVPASYLPIGKEIYGDYAKLTLFMDYSWNGALMSMRTVNLLTLEEQSSIAKEFINGA